MTIEINNESGVKVDEALFEELEFALISADCGVDASQRIAVGIQQDVARLAAALARSHDPALLERADLRSATVADDAAGFLAAVEHAISRRRRGESS